MWKVKYANGKQKGPMPLKQLFKIIENGFVPIDSYFISTELRNWIDMETLLDMQFQDLEDNIHAFVNVNKNVNVRHSLSTATDASSASSSKHHQHLVQKKSRTNKQMYKDNNNNNRLPQQNVYQEKNDIPHMVQCDRYGGIYESTGSKLNGKWKRLGYSKTPLECVAIHPLTHKLTGVRKVSRNGISRSLLITLERGSLDSKSTNIFPSTEMSLSFSNVKHANLNIKSLTYSTCMDDGKCTLYGVAERNHGHELLGTDSICRINPKTKIVDLILATGCHDVDAIASPYELLGENQDIAFLFWSRKLGLHEVHWFGNNRIELVTKETPPQYKKRRLSSLYFTQDGDLFGVSGNDVLPFGNMAVKGGDPGNDDTGKYGGHFIPGMHVVEASDLKVVDESSLEQQQQQQQQPINMIIDGKNMKKKKKDKKKKSKVNFSIKTKNKGTQNDIDTSTPKVLLPVSSPKTQLPPSTTRSPQPTDYQRQHQREDWEYFVMSERERRYQAEANAWGWMQHAYYAQMEAQRQAYYHQYQHQQYLMYHHGQHSQISPLALSQYQHVYTNNVPTTPTNNFETPTSTNTYNPLQNTTKNSNDFKVDEHYLEEKLRAFSKPDVESDDNESVESTILSSTPSPVITAEATPGTTSNDRRGSMLRNQKMRRQTSVGLLLVHEQGNGKFRGGETAQTTYHESFHNFFASNQNGNNYLVPRYLLLGSAAHRGSISGGSLHTRVGQLYLSNSDDFNNMTKIGKSVPNLNALASSNSGQVFGVSNRDILLKIDPNTGNTLALGTLKFYDTRRRYSYDIDVVDIGFGRWLDGRDTLYGLMKCSPDLLGICSDAIVSIDIQSGKCTLVAETHRRGVTAFASPPLEGGPWGGTIFYFWVEKQGLFEMKWANQQFTVGNLISGSQTQFNIRSLIFNLNNDLLGFGSSMYVITPQERNIVRVQSLPLTSLKVIILRHEPLLVNTNGNLHHGISQEAGLKDFYVDEVVTDTEEHY
jgi:hypothetical protein